MGRRYRDFQLEIRLGLALIVLVLVVLNISSHYVLFRVKQSVELQIKDELYEAAVMTAGQIHRLHTVDLPDSAVEEITDYYSLDDLSILHFNYDRVMAIQKGYCLDPEWLSLDSAMSPDDLKPLLLNKPVFRHKSGDEYNMVFFPTELAGSKFIIAVGRNSTLLSSVEKAGRTLVFVGLLGILVIIYASLKFVRFAVYPFKRLKEKAEKSGHLEHTSGDDVVQLISSYEKIIDRLKEKEKELVELNKIVSRRADDLEVYNNYILESISAGIITLDSERNISTVNRAVIKIFGFADVDMAGENYRKLLEDYPELLSLIEQFFTDGMTIDNQKVHIADDQKNGQILNISISHLTDSQGNDIGVSVILNDQTDFFKLQAELELKKRMALLGEMSGGLAHQLRNSVAAIVGFAKLIGKKAKGESIIRQNIDLLLKESSEAEALVSRFLDFARPLELRPVELKIGGLIAEVVAATQEKYSNIKIEPGSISGEQLFIPGDPLLLKQALGNIVDNACESYDGAEGEVRIKVEKTSAWIQVRVVDSGSGIPDEYKDKIFTPFFSGSPSGSGLGLPLARKIITLHDGRLDFESASGKGTTFMISLPLAQAPTRETRAAKEPIFNS